MALRQQPRGRPATIEELLTVQRQTAPTRCTHCERDRHDHDRDVVEAALRHRIRVLEDRVAKLEAWVCGLS